MDRSGVQIHKTPIERFAIEIFWPGLHRVTADSYHHVLGVGPQDPPWTLITKLLYLSHTTNCRGAC
jgi:hypothetical protein